MRLRLVARAINVGCSTLDLEIVQSNTPEYHTSLLS